MKKFTLKRRAGRRGMTLVELLVAMACGTMVLTMLLSMMIFISNSSEDIIGNGEDFTVIAATHKKIRSLGLTALPAESDFLIDGEGTLSYKGSEILQDERLESISFHSSEDGKIIKCRLRYNGKELVFAAGGVE